MLSTSLRLIALTLLGVAVLVQPVLAQKPPLDPVKEAAAKELLAAMNVQEQFRKTLDSMQAVLAQQIKAQPGGDKAVATIGKIFAADSEHVKSYLTDAETAMVAFYAERFTAEEMKEITAFQVSAAGKKLQSSMPEMVKALGPPIAKFQESVKKILVDELSAKPKQ
jgi:hypothetical protein